MNQERPVALDPAAPPDQRTKPVVAPPRDTGEVPPPRRRRRWVWLLILLAAGAAFYWWTKGGGGRAGTQGGAAGGPQGARGRGPMQVPVVGAKAHKGNIPVIYTGLGGVTPVYTVSVRSRVDGELMDVRYREGQLVHQGDPLVEVDPRPFQVQLTQAEGQLIRDQALLENARIDLARYKTLLPQNAIPEQQVATQEALVKQYEGIVKTDQGVIDNAKLNLVYCNITAPVTGKVGLRLVDPGNIVHAADTNPVVVITQLEPITVIFTLNEDQLQVVLQKLHAGQHLRADAYDRTSNRKLATGVLTTVDNQIDPTTGTLRLRATFDNKDGALFPNQFVNVRLLVQLKQGVTLVPTAAIQRNNETTYVFLVKPDSSVTVRPITVGTTEGEESEVTSGLQPGDVIVMTGVDKLEEGTKVKVSFGGPTMANPTPGSSSQAPGAPTSGAPVGTPSQGGRPTGTPPNTPATPNRGAPAGTPPHGGRPHQAA